MLAQLNSKEEIKQAKKSLTKLANKLQKKAYKLGESMKDFTKIANRDFRALTINSQQFSNGF